MAGVPIFTEASRWQNLGDACTQTGLPMNAVYPKSTVPSEHITCATELGHELPVPLRAAIVYGSAASGRRAMAVMQRLVAEFGETVHLIPTLCRFDLLAVPGLRDHAIADAASADLLIVATDRADELPGPVQQWLDDLVVHRRDRPLTLLAIWADGDEWTIRLWESNAANPLPRPDSFQV